MEIEEIEEVNEELDEDGFDDKVDGLELDD